jgi:RNA polymerase sigma factor (sigma-70 family)
MATESMSTFLHHLTRQMAAESLADQSDQQLVEKALAGRDEAVFRAIVRRHGAMVYRVCRRVLRHDQNAEDAFQATFLVLARKLASVRKHASLASWLHGVAHRVALQARDRDSTLRRHEQEAAIPEAMPPEDVTWGEVCEVLDAELGRLPEKWRLPLILCYLEGRTQDEAAEQLGWSKNTLRTRLGEARAALGRRLTRRGIAWSAALAAVLLSDCVASAVPSPGLVFSTVQAAARVAAGQAAGETVSAKAAALTEGMVKPVFLTKLNAAMAGLLVLGLLAFGAGVVPRGPSVAARAGQPEMPPARKKETDPQPGIDLAKIDRTIRKEPVYAGKPRYALLVLGAKAEQRMWLVIDDKARTLYADRNGNGDLTEADEKLALDKRETRLIPDILEFHLGAFTEADGKTAHVDLVVTQYVNILLGDKVVNTVSLRDGTGEFGQTTNGEDGCAFAEKAKDAPVIHMNGPLTLRAYWVWVEYDRGTGRKIKLVSESGGLLDFPEESTRGNEVPYQLKAGERVSELHVQVGTPGLGKGAFAALSVEKGFDPKLHPRAEIAIPSRTDANKLVTAEFLLKSRCCGTHFHAPVQLPAEAGAGEGLITLSFPGLDSVAPAVMKLLLVGPPPAGGKGPSRE